MWKARHNYVQRQASHSQPHPYPPPGWVGRLTPVRPKCDPPPPHPPRAPPMDRPCPLPTRTRLPTGGVDSGATGTSPHPHLVVVRPTVVLRDYVRPLHTRVGGLARQAHALPRQRCVAGHQLVQLLVVDAVGGLDLWMASTRNPPPTLSRRRQQQTCNSTASCPRHHATPLPNAPQPTSYKHPLPFPPPPAPRHRQMPKGTHHAHLGVVHLVCGGAGQGKGKQTHAQPMGGWSRRGAAGPSPGGGSACQELPTPAAAAARVGRAPAIPGSPPRGRG